jgi:cell division protein FtsB
MTMAMVPRERGETSAGRARRQPSKPAPGIARADDAKSAELEDLRRENALLHGRIARLEREAAAMRALVAETKRMQMWDFTPYRVQPDESWIAVDRASAARVLAALAGIDHWDPWHSRIEPRPEP